MGWYESSCSGPTTRTGGQPTVTPRTTQDPVRRRARGGSDRQRITQGAFFELLPHVPPGSCGRGPDRWPWIQAPRRRHSRHSARTLNYKALAVETPRLEHQPAGRRGHPRACADGECRSPRLDGLAFYSLAGAGYGDQLEAGSFVEMLGIRDADVHRRADRGGGALVAGAIRPGPRRPRRGRTRLGGVVTVLMAHCSSGATASGYVGSSNGRGTPASSFVHAVRPRRPRPPPVAGDRRHITSTATDQGTRFARSRSPPGHTRLNGRRRGTASPLTR